MNEHLPSRKEALRLLEEAGCSQEVINHCKAVVKLAVKTAFVLQNRGFNVEVRLVEIGALLHDIGRSQSHEVNHALIGSEIAQSLGLPIAIVSIIERHVGGGITIQEAKQLGWPVKSYLPQTLEEKIVNYADKLVEGTRKVSIQRTIQELSKKLGKSHPAIDRVTNLYNEISQFIGNNNRHNYTA